MNIIAIVGLGAAAASVSVIMRRINGEYSLFISAAASLIILFICVSALSPLTELIKELTEMSGADSAFIGILMKSLAVCFVTGLAADCCRDAGDSAVASKIEFAGKTAVLLISVPLFESLLGIIKELII